MPQYALEGVVVDFPFEAYPCQLDYMGNVIRALKQRTNALLESPTGTGKTLCLLCATLAWRESLKTSMEPPQQQQHDPTATAGSVKIHQQQQQQQHAGSSIEALPPIIYSSRTHSQLAQVMRELRNTSYRPRSAVLASRGQTCQHHDVSQLSGGVATAACNALANSRSCQWYTKVDEYTTKNPDLNKEPIDIEELVRLGQTPGGPCPYFLAKEMANGAEIIFVPYNYLIDERSRQSMSLDWNGSVVIFDEAHNVEGVCSDSFSLDINAVNLAAAIQEVVRAREVVLGLEANMGPMGGGLSEEGQAKIGPRSAEDFKMLAALLKKLEAAIAEFPIGDNGVTKPGAFIFTLLDSLNINTSTYEAMCEKLGEAADVLVDQALGSGSRRGAQLTDYKINWVVDCLKAIFKTQAPSSPGLPPLHLGFRVHIHKEKTKGGKTAPTLSYWCFHPGLSMNEMAKLGIRSILLTSGTLSPLDSFAYELSLPFPVRLENPHVIDPRQVYIGVVSKGPMGEPLNSSYQNRDKPRYKADLGNVIVNFARCTPDGLLVFFPSYRALEGCLDYWKNCSDGGTGGTIWERLMRHKHPVVEPRTSAAFAEAAADFKAKVDDPKSGGAVFFAVCRGKVSEGLDFSDRAGRAVIITGIPYPMKMDPKVRLKQQVLDEDAAKLRSRGRGAQASLSGSQWYSQQAMRAVNQALGRVIRHRNDFGAILLCDQRFAAPATKNQLSMWLRNRVEEPPTFGAAAAHLQKFFKVMKADPKLSASLSIKDTAAASGAPGGSGSSGSHRPQGSSSGLPPPDAAGPVVTKGLGDLSKSLLVASLPAAADSVCPGGKKRTAVALFGRGDDEGQQQQQQQQQLQAKIGGSASRLLGLMAEQQQAKEASSSQGSQGAASGRAPSSAASSAVSLLLDRTNNPGAPNSRPTGAGSHGAPGKRGFMADPGFPGANKKACSKSNNLWGSLAAGGSQRSSSNGRPAPIVPVASAAAAAAPPKATAEPSSAAEARQKALGKHPSETQTARPQGKRPPQGGPAEGDRGGAPSSTARSTNGLSASSSAVTAGAAPSRTGSNASNSSQAKQGQQQQQQQQQKQLRDQQAPPRPTRAASPAVPAAAPTAPQPPGKQSRPPPAPLTSSAAAAGSGKARAGVTQSAKDGAKASCRTFLDRLRKVMLKRDYKQFVEAMKRFTAKEISIADMVDKACQLLPTEELPGLGAYLGTQGSKILHDRIHQGGSTSAPEVK